MEKTRGLITRRTLITAGVLIAIIVLTNSYAHDQLNFNSKAYADGQHLVSVFVDGQKRVVATSAPTVQSALNQLGVKVGAGDVVEPAQTSAINQPVFNVNIYRALPATIFDDGKKVQVLTGYQSPRQIVAAAGLTTYPEDIVRMDRVDDFTLGATVGREVSIKRAKPIQVVLAGRVYNFRTQKTTVGELLSEKGLQVQPSDIVSAGLGEQLSAGQRIVVNRLSQTITQAKEAIPSVTSYEYDGNQPLGYTAVKQAGKAGTKLVSYVVELKDGNETGRKVLEEKVLEEAIAQVIVKGSRVMPPSTNLTARKSDLMSQAGIAPKDFGYVDYIVGHEGGWDGVQRYNRAGSGAYGLCQAMPGNKMVSAGADWATNPVTQLRWCNSYAISKFGSWANAYDYWLKRAYW